MDNLHLKIVNSFDVIFDGDIISIITKNEGGEFEILKNHSPLITITVPSKTTIKTMDGKIEKFYTSQGIMKILNNDILFIVDNGEESSNIDKKRAEESKKRALERLSNKQGIDILRAKRSLIRANERLRTIE